MKQTSSSSKTVRVAAVQMAPDLKTIDGTVQHVLNAIADAASKGAQLIVFPESFIPYYPYFSVVRPPAAIGAEHSRLYENAVCFPSPTVDALSEAARHHHIIVSVGVTERDNGTLYNSQLIFDNDGSLILKHRKISLAFHERMIWGEGDGTSIKVVDSTVGRLGTLICWEHYNPLARFSLIAQHEEIHISSYIGSMFGQTFSDQTEAQLRNHALESGCFVINATAWLSTEQRESITTDPQMLEVISGGCMTAIIGPDGKHIAPPISNGEGILIADLDFSHIVSRKRMMDAVGHYSRPDLFSLTVHSKETPHIRNSSEQEEPINTLDVGGVKGMNAKNESQA
ncbi:amidohydrolase [Pseudomonas sp. RIT-PI-q]|uniref:nitrilase-related carbon-nitrogen hydrolase n=1 Tax=Pseudomonas sp. RIT-PI-q TaxID=1690247 RepID=UPI0006CCFF3B|nr:nitrilase-related carbon-nitrogen hydrolase [Pseudomonas sp. RIT-PI-q]KPG95961.1 amidohydrolase [Pseudomonas sp. RIT-PI-q]